MSRRGRACASRGFTLVEILVVVLIIGLGIGIVSFSVGGNRPQVLRKDANVLANQMAAVAGETEMGAETWGVQFYRDRTADGEENFIAWRWLHFREPGVSPDEEQDKRREREKTTKNRFGWQPETPRDGEPGGRFESTVEAVLEIEGREVTIDYLPAEKEADKRRDDERDALQPDVWLTPGGEMTPFALHLKFIGDEQGPIVRGDALGRVEVDLQNADE